MGGPRGQDFDGCIRNSPKQREGSKMLLAGSMQAKEAENNGRRRTLTKFRYFVNLKTCKRVL